MQNKGKRNLVFLVSNFLALWVGTILMENGPRSDWYLALDKAPWTPPGFMFGLAWSIIMVLFAFYMTRLSFLFKDYDKKIITLYVVQWLLNVGWNYAFFNQQQFQLGLVILIILWGLLLFMAITYRKQLRTNTLLLMPYFIWMTIAVSLNAYVVMNN